MRLCKEELMCAVVSQRLLKSVAKIRLVKTASWKRLNRYCCDL
jgi:hypothetical protein